MDIQSQIHKLMPSMRLFAISLTKNIDVADDLVQEAVVKALSNLHSFTEGTNLRAWLFTILRNTYFSDLRRRRYEITTDNPSDLTESVSTNPSQEDVANISDVDRALRKIPAEQRSALLKAHVQGMSYEEIAKDENVAIGTIKSRVNRAVDRLRKILGEEYDEYGNVPIDHEAVASRKKYRKTIRTVNRLNKQKIFVPRYPVVNYSADEIAAFSDTFQVSQPSPKTSTVSVAPMRAKPEISVREKQVAIVESETRKAVSLAWGVELPPQLREALEAVGMKGPHAAACVVHEGGGVRIESTTFKFL